MQNIDDIKKMGFQFKEKCILLEGSGVELQNSMNLELRYDIEKSQDDVIRLVCTSRFLVDKGIYELINAISVVRMLGLNVKLVLALKVYHLDDINSIISKFEKFSWLDLYFNLHDVTSILKSSDVYIYPSYYREGIPRGILEAMAASLPILTTSMPGCKETVVNGVNGFLFTPKSVLSIVDKIFRILTTGCDLKKMGNESFLIFENRFSSKKINKQLLNIYNDSERFKFDSKVSGMF
jgi:glycosyltransferase involved in cell wall biosynthesis